MPQPSSCSQAIPVETLIALEHLSGIHCLVLLGLHDGYDGLPRLASFLRRLVLLLDLVALSLLVLSDLLVSLVVRHPDKSEWR